MASAHFLYFIAGEGNTPLLKAELARSFPNLRLAYSRGTFLTCKTETLAPSPADDPRPLFAVTAGRSLGKTCGAELAGRAAAALDDPCFGGGPALLDSFFCQAEAAELRRALGTRLRSDVPTAARSSRDIPVLEVVKTHDDEFYLGFHPYGDCRTVLNDYDERPAPSRAYHKIREACRLTGVEPTRGQTVLDLGAAPGGASLFFLERGLSVVAVDPAVMDPAVAGHQEFLVYAMSPVKRAPVKRGPAQRPPVQRAPTQRTPVKRGPAPRRT